MSESELKLSVNDELFLKTSPPMFSWLMRYDSSNEKEFKNWQFVARKNYQIFALLSGLFIYSLFGILDYLIGGPSAELVLSVRLFVCLPIMAVLTFFYSRCDSSSVGLRLMSGYLLIAGGSIAWMILVSDGPIENIYSIGVLVVICFGAGFCGHDFLHNLIVNLVLVALTICCLILSDAASWVLISSMAFLIAAILTMAIASRINEHLERIRFKMMRDSMISQAQALMGTHSMRQFLATVSHELRTPLNAIIGFSETMKEEVFGPIGNEHYVGYVEDIRKSGIHLSSLIDDIMDVSNIEYGRQELSTEHTSLRDVVDEACRMCSADLIEKKHELFVTEHLHIVIDADSKRLVQAVINLLNNASKFIVKPPGRIEIEIGMLDSGLPYISVEDDGPGIPSESLSDIVEPFKRLEDSYSARTPGLGLGLSIIVQVMKLHGGELVIESSVGDGTIMTLQFPNSCLVSSSDLDQRLSA